MRQNFKSYMAAELNAYMEYRRGLGYVGTQLYAPLRAFDRYLCANVPRKSPLPPSFFLEMRNNLQKEPLDINRMLSALRGFFLFLVRQEVYETNPVEDIPPLPVRAFVPFVFSPEQIDQLLRAACETIRKRENNLLPDMAAYVAIVLYARCGLRLREPFRLRAEHYRPCEGTLYIEKTKFKKDRLIPVPKSVRRDLDNYLAARQSLLPNDRNPFLLANRQQTALNACLLYRRFEKALRRIGLDEPRRVMGDIVFGNPRVHSLRHAFAVNTLKRIRLQGKDPQNALPVLAAYMGHAKYQYTAAYLKVLDADNLQGLIGFAKSQLDLV
jgi:integrase/recombinase XerD